LSLPMRASNSARRASSIRSRSVGGGADETGDEPSLVGAVPMALAGVEASRFGGTDVSKVVVDRAGLFHSMSKIFSDGHGATEGAVELNG